MERINNSTLSEEEKNQVKALVFDGKVVIKSFDGVSDSDLLLMLRASIKYLASSSPDSTKATNMRKKVMRRNLLFWYGSSDEVTKFGPYMCDICGRETNTGKDFINSHIIAKAHARTLYLARLENKYSRLPSSPSYDYNGLFCCKTCDSHFEDHVITIDGKGVIHYDKSSKPAQWKDKYEKLDNTKVKWADLIDKNIAWPTSETLDYRNTLPPVCGKHREVLFGVDEDDHSAATESEMSEDENQVVEASLQKKLHKVKRRRVEHKGELDKRNCDISD